MDKFSSIYNYIESYPDNVKEKLYEIRSIIKEVVPNGVELFNYSIPAIRLIENGKREQQIMYAGYKKHIGFYPHPTTIEEFKSELVIYKQGKGSIQFPLNKPLPKELIIRMVKYRKRLIESENE